MATRGKFARVCIEVDLRKPLCPRFILGKNCYNIEYESIHSFCFHCGRVDHRKELCKHSAAHSKAQETQRTNTPSEGHPVGVAGSKDLSPTVVLSDNGNLLQPKVDDGTYGPWMMVTKKNRRPTIIKKTQTNGPSPSNNRFSGLDTPTEQEEQSRGRKTTCMGVEKDPHDSNHEPSSAIAQAQNLQKHITTTGVNSNNPIGQANPMLPNRPATQVTPQYIPNQASDIIQLLEKDKISQETNNTLTRTPPSANLSLLGNTTKPTISSKEEMLVDAPTTHTTNSLSPELVYSGGDGATRNPKPPDPGIIHGARRETTARSNNPQDGEPTDRTIVRTRERSNSPRRYNLVDRADKAENRTKLELQTRASVSLAPDGIHEIN
ncbi:uncharacterized protein LOC114290628 [Camellia sinensis]|uniref:uncharacterized protein LOC114290628 n=1 Tax=Camellia sinensis TaxID=4442 RepID=UPI001035736E|nr:uncharacterized protein LOC114290628 [Camellia sinensis]